MDLNDVRHFRRLLTDELRNLLQLCQKWENANYNLKISDEISGQIRTVIGQTHLLINQRFKQFSGLIDNCEFQSEDKETTCNDLQGFWDMIYYQVKDIHNKFKTLEELENNDWKPIENVKSSEGSTKTISKRKSRVLQSNSALRNHIHATRQKMKLIEKAPSTTTRMNLEDKENINTRILKIPPDDSSYHTE